MTERLVLAIDGGNSKTDVVLATGNGGLLTQVRGAGSSPHQLGVEGCVLVLNQLVRRAWQQAGYFGHVAVDRAEIYLAGADLPAEVVALRQAVEQRRWATETVVGNDAFALLRAGTDNVDAVAVVCGAGINCVGQASDGRVATFPSLGQITGDWGGGRHLGYEALWHAARGEDGRGPRTRLQTAIAAHFGHTTVADVSAEMHVGGIVEERVCELAPALFAAAAVGDVVARGIVERLARELAVLVEVTLRRLDLLTARVPVVLGGGIVRGQHAALVPLVRERLQAGAPSAEITVVSSPPVLGAVLYGLDALQSDSLAKKRMSEALRYPM